jgi:uncharacterized membrane protein (DUF2068 family)
MTTTDQRPVGFVPLGIFFFFAATMGSLAAITLGFPGTILDRAWELNKSGHAQLMPLGRIMGLPFVVVAVVALCAGIGWFKRRRWAWIVGVLGIAVNLVGDVINMAIGERWKGLIGVGIAGLLLIYLTRPKVRDYLRE